MITNETSWEPALPDECLDAGTEFRYGMLKLSKRLRQRNHPPGRADGAAVWNGNAFVTNADDSCTRLPTASIALGNYRSNLSACETAPVGPSVAFRQGRGSLRMQRPGAGNAGSADATVHLGAVPTTPAPGPQQCSTIGAPPSLAVTAAMPWLQGKRPAAVIYDQNPSARISFGAYRSPLIHLREMY